MYNSRNSRRSRRSRRSLRSLRSKKYKRNLKYRGGNPETRDSTSAENAFIRSYGGSNFEGRIKFKHFFTFYNISVKNNGTLGGYDLTGEPLDLKKFEEFCNRRDTDIIPTVTSDFTDDISRLDASVNLMLERNDGNSIPRNPFVNRDDTDE